MDFEEFAGRARDAGLELSDGDMRMLFDEIAASCDVARAMSERIRIRLSAGAEPALVFRREPGQADG